MNNIWVPFKKEIELIIKNKKKVIGVVLSIIFLIVIWTNVFLKKGSKEYYIDMVKNMESGLDGYTLEELLKSIFEEYVIEPNIKWDYIEDKQIVSVTISDNDNNSESRYYSVKNGPSNIEEVYMDGSSVNENLYNIVGNVLDEKYYSSEDNYEENNYEEDNDKETEDIINETLVLQEDDYNYGSYIVNELGNKYSTYAGINTIKDNDIETIKEILLDMNFIGCSNNIGDSLKNYFEDIQFNEYQTEKGVTINISGYSEKLENDLMLSILATYKGDVYLTEIRQGKSNSMIDISSQLEIAENIFK